MQNKVVLGKTSDSVLIRVGNQSAEMSLGDWSRMIATPLDRRAFVDTTPSDYVAPADGDCA